MYWDLVLEEVLNKDSSKQHFAFTNIKEISAKHKTPRRAKKNNQEIRVKVYKLGDKYGNIYFTRREAECMTHLLQGKTINRVARDLKLSPRTIEFYVKNMRVKLAATSKFDLIEKVVNSDFLENVDFM